MVDVELALLRSLVRTGLAPPDAETDADADAGSIDIGALGVSSGERGTPVPALVRTLGDQLAEQSARFLHRGATSQDIVDTAIMLVARRALDPLLADLGSAAGVCARLAEEHRASLQPARTLLQQAVPSTFGLKAAGWLVALDSARSALAHIGQRDLAVQLGGAAGTLAALGERGLEVTAELARELGLAQPVLPWHTIRLLPARLACELAAGLGAMAKIARDVILLAQTEVAELSEGAPEGHGGSSTMPQKRNPVKPIAVVACAQRAPGLAATILSSMAQEHERAAGGWQAEWEPLLELLRLCGSAASSLHELLDRLEIHPDRMRANLNLTGGLLMSESVAAVLAEYIGRSRAQELVEAAARRVGEDGRELGDVLLELPEIAATVDRQTLKRALSPENYLGVADRLIDRALAAHRDRGSK
jgi:3-carboxy-cis,cis-muconate cycloisomerase